MKRFMIPCKFEEEKDNFIGYLREYSFLQSISWVRYGDVDILRAERDNTIFLNSESSAETRTMTRVVQRRHVRSLDARFFFASGVVKARYSSLRRFN